jgi:hypothetical protein
LWGSPALFIKKKDGTYRLVVDYCPVNQATIKKNLFHESMTYMIN